MALFIFYGLLFFMLVIMPLSVRYADCTSENKPFLGKAKSEVNSGAKFG